MFYMELILIDGKKAGSWTESEYGAYNWFFNTACRPDVEGCKVYKAKNDGTEHLSSVLRYHRPKE